MTLIGILLFIFITMQTFLLLFFMGVNKLKTDEERILEDEEQMNYLSEHKSKSFFKRHKINLK